MSNGNDDAHNAAARPVYLLPPIMTVEAAIARMEAIDAYIDRREPRGPLDGVARFNSLYKVITQRVKEGIDNGMFEDPEFLTTLDIEFANRYLNALRDGVQDPGEMPRSWKVLVEKRGDARVHPLQFAVAGVNAHINYDLAFALLSTWEILGTGPDTRSQRRDYDRINDIFDEEMSALRQSFEDEWEQNLDEAAAPVLNLVGTVSIVAAREAAWRFGESLHRIGPNDFLRGLITRQVDGSTALVGHLLLQPLLLLELERDLGNGPSPSPAIGAVAAPARAVGVPAAGFGVSAEALAQLDGAATRGLNGLLAHLGAAAQAAGMSSEGFAQLSQGALAAHRTAIESGESGASGLAQFLGDNPQFARVVNAQQAGHDSGIGL